MRSENSYKRNVYFYLLAYLLFWIILFEFILPVNNVLPRPSILPESFAALWDDYGLIINVLSSIAAVYVSILASYYLIRILNSVLLNTDSFTGFILSMEWFSKYIPGFVLGIFLILWFPQSYITKYIFIFFTSFFSLLIKYFSLSKKVNTAYVDFARSVGAAKNIVADRVIWKNIQPDLIDHIINSHLYFWSMLLIFEFINAGSGIGLILRSALEFKDLSAIFSVLIILGLIIYLGSLSIKLLKTKFFFWSGVE